MSSKDRRWPLSRPLNRRELLQAAAGGALATVGLAGCGGGGSSGPGGGVGGLTGDQLNASLQAIEDNLNAAGGQSRDARLTSVLNLIRSRPEIIGSGLDEDGVWAVYSNGIPVMILDNRYPEELPAELRSVPPPTSRGTDVPGSRRARLINTLGPGYVDEVPIVRPILESKGYTILVDSGTVEHLRSVSGDGVFYMSAHAGRCYLPEIDPQGNVVLNPNGTVAVTQTFGICSATYFSPSDPFRYFAEMKAGLIGIAFAPQYQGPIGQVWNRQYAITVAWVEQKMRFGDNSLVWFSGNHTNSTLRNNGLAARCVDNNAGLYVGWTNFVSSGACVVAGRFILDRLLGYNNTNPRETPPQRPFDYEQVWSDLRQHGLHVHPTPPLLTALGPTTEITFRPGRANFGLLAPSIEFVQVNEFEDRAVLDGLFGNPVPGERVVMIGGQPADIIDWQENQIICKLERSGAGSAGDVQVIVREHKSNIRRITEWNVPMRYEFKNPDKPPLKVSGDVFVRFRADVGEYRTAAHQAPIKPTRAAIATRDSEVNLTGSGQWALDDYCTASWHNNVVWVPADYGAATHTFACRMKIDTNPVQDPVAGTVMKGAIGLAFGLEAPPGPFLARVDCDPYTDIDGNFHPATSEETHFMVTFGKLYGQDMFPSPDPNSPPIPIFAIQIDFGTDFRIPAGVVEDITDGLVRLEWTAVVPSFPPDPQAARSAPVKRTGSSQPTYRRITSGKSRTLIRGKH